MTAVRADLATLADGRTWRPTVQLQHTLPDGSRHIDWMLATGAAGTDSLVTFQLPRPLHQIGPDPVTIERLDDHRAAYLTYEGPVSGNRGSVRRIASGIAILASEHGGSIQIVCEWGGEDQSDLASQPPARTRSILSPAPDGGFILLSTGEGAIDPSQ